MNNDLLECDDQRCVLTADDLEGRTDERERAKKFNEVIADIVKVYPSALLVGAVAAAKYIRYPNSPRETHDVDVLLDEKDFAEFLVDEIPEHKQRQLEKYFDDSDSLNHSMRHRGTGIYVDFLSAESQSIRKKLIQRILSNRAEATHILQDRENGIEILKPEYLLAMKVNRYCKYSDTERGASDRLDIIKILETLKERDIPVDHELVRGLLNRNEVRYYDKIVAENE
jgi:hypothetical protein